MVSLLKDENSEMRNGRRKSKSTALVLGRIGNGELSI